MNPADAVAAPFYYRRTYHCRCSRTNERRNAHILLKSFDSINNVREGLFGDVDYGLSHHVLVKGKYVAVRASMHKGEILNTQSTP